MESEIPSTQEDALVRLGNAMRILCQLTGLILVLIGVYFAMSMFFRFIGMVNNPPRLQEPLKQVEKLIGADELVLNAAGRPLPFGKLASAAILTLWALAAVWIPLSVIYVGGRIVAWNFDERRHIRMILQEFLAKTGREPQGKATG